MKKGDLMLFDAIIAISLLIIFIILFNSYNYGNSDKYKILNNYAKESASLFDETIIEDLDISEISSIPESIMCSKCTVAQQIILLMIDGNESLAKNISISFFKDYMAPQYGYSLYVNGSGLDKELILKNSSTMDDLAVSKKFIFGAREYSKETFIFEIRVWG